MNYYKPYSIEWSRRRYLQESIEKYFDDNIDIEFLLNDIEDIILDKIDYHSSKAEKFKKLLQEFNNSAINNK